MTNDMIKKLKTTWTAFGGLTKDEQAFLKENKEAVGQIDDCGLLGFIGHYRVGLHPGMVYRLRPDYEEPKERWFVCIADSENNGLLVSRDDASVIREFTESKHWLEIKTDADTRLQHMDDIDTIEKDAARLEPRVRLED